MAIKHEAKAQVIFNQYLREKRPYGYFELKHTDKAYFPFSKIEQVQYDGLQATEKEGFVWKLSDMDSRPKPCDCLSMPPLPSYIVISFVRTFYFIRIRDIVKMKEEGKLSVTLEEAKIMAEKIVDY
jgi:hypothetical protein